MARAVTTRTKVGYTAAAWLVALLIFFPILCTILTSFKTEAEAIAAFSLDPLVHVRELPSRPDADDYFKPFLNSVIISVGSTLLALLIAIPAAWAMAFSPTKRTKDVLMWMLSTKMMPAVGVLVPIYLIFLDTGLLDTRIGLTIILMLINLPIIVWMLYTYFKEIPARSSRRRAWTAPRSGTRSGYVLTPMAVPGIASTLLLNIILAWNESFWTIKLTTANAAPLTAFIAVLLQPAGPVLGQALGRLDPRHRADPDHGLVQPEAAGPRPDLRRREIRRKPTMGKIKLRDVNKSFGATDDHPELDLDIEDGEFVVFVGPSGCGKSTLLRLIAGLEDTTSGNIMLDGRDVTGKAPAKRGLAMVFQSYALYPHMTVGKNIAFPLKMAGEDKAVDDKKVADAARILNLTDYLDRSPGQLSGGQRQRVAIGRAIVREPKAFLFDEPLSNLDAALRVNMRLEITELHQQLGRPMIYVTHDQVEAMTMADKIVVLNAGRIEQFGSPMELYKHPEEPLRRRLHRLARR